MNNLAAQLTALHCSTMNNLAAQLTALHCSTMNNLAAQQTAQHFSTSAKTHSKLPSTSVAIYYPSVERQTAAVNWFKRKVLAPKGVEKLAANGELIRATWLQVTVTGPM